MTTWGLVWAGTAMAALLPSWQGRGGDGARAGEPAAPGAGVQAETGSEGTDRVAKWHPFEVWLEGPWAWERQESPNPFLDLRVRVTFRGPSGARYVVPAFFDGDGRGASAGTVWKARFAADQVGRWTWKAEFEQGPDLAIDLVSAGTPTPFDGQSGVFEVVAVPPGAPGFLRLGRLEYVDGHYMKFRDGGYFIKAGTDSPENFLGFSGFDEVIDQGGVGIVHDYGPHVADWRLGDPEFGPPGLPQAGRGIIGALNYLSSVGVNSVYFLPMNLGGDGQETCPFVGYGRTAFDKTHYDLSRLLQWNQVFEHAQRRGIMLQLVLAETEPKNEKWFDEGSFGRERKLFFRELIARFGHLLGIKWNLSEENDFPVWQLREMAAYIRALDPYDHPIAVHTRSDDFSDYWPLLGNADFTHTSIQYDPARAGAHVEDWRSQSALAGEPWIIDMDENNPAGEGLTDANADELRKRVLFDVYFSGGQIEWYAGGHPLPLGGDQNLEDFRTREAMWDSMRFARRFMEDHIPFWRMEPTDQLVTGESAVDGGAEVLAREGEVYAIYLPDASLGATLDTIGHPGPFEVRWFDPRAGRFAGFPSWAGGDAPIPLGPPSSEPGEDWVLLVKRMTLIPDRLDVSASAAGTQTLRIDAGSEFAFADYQLLGSQSGIDGDIRIAQGVTLPLAWDGYTSHLFSDPSEPAFAGLKGRLDAQGRATVSITFAFPFGPAHVGETLVHAALVGHGVVELATNPVPLLLVP